MKSVSVIASMIFLGFSACAVPAQEEPTATTEDELTTTTTTGSGAKPEARQDGAYCFVECSGTWYVNPRITTDCASYGMTQVCPHGRGDYQGATWCLPITQQCPSPAFVL